MWFGLAVVAAFMPHSAGFRYPEDFGADRCHLSTLYASSLIFCECSSGKGAWRVLIYPRVFIGSTAGRIFGPLFDLLPGLVVTGFTGESGAVRFFPVKSCSHLPSQVLTPPFVKRHLIQDIYVRCLGPYTFLAMGSTTNTAVAIPVKDQSPLTIRLVEQLVKQNPDEHIWIFDNGSTKEESVAISHLTDFKDVQIFARADSTIYQMWNEAIDTAANANIDNLAILNNDLIVGPQFIEHLTASQRVASPIGAVSANWKNATLADHTQRIAGTASMSPPDTNIWFAGFAFMVAVDRIGDIRCDEELNWWYGDDDLCLQITQAGLHLAMSQNAKIIHLFEQTASVNPDLASQTVADRQYFINKWGLNDDHTRTDTGRTTGTETETGTDTGADTATTTAQRTKIGNKT